MPNGPSQKRFNDPHGVHEKHSARLSWRRVTFGVQLCNAAVGLAKSWEPGTRARTVGA